MQVTLPKLPGNAVPFKGHHDATPQSHAAKSFWGDWISTFTQHSEATVVADLYPNVSWQWEHKTGWRDYSRKVSTRIESAYRSGETKTRTMMAVILYTVWLGIDAVFFTAELIIRFCGFQRKRRCFQDHWFIFDFVLALLMIVEVWIMPIIFIFAPDVSEWFKQFTLLRTLRLARLARLTSLLRAFPEAMMLLKGAPVPWDTLGYFGMP
eukprot:Skav212184  [mRNA]  locus=scaffold754:499746:503501:- [translate_table: standard]